MHPIEDIDNPQEKSRFEETLKQKTKKNMFIAFGGIAALLLVGFLVGPYLLIGMGMLFGRSTPIETKPAQEEIIYIAPPTLHETFDATASASITLKGSGSKKTKIALYNNNTRVQTTLADANGNYTFNNITLKEGDNSFQTKNIIENGESDYSNKVRVKLLVKNPSLEITSPSDGDKFNMSQSPIQIKGKTDPDVKVTVNDFWAIVDTMGNYTYSYPLKDGDNTLSVKATDKAGNVTTREIKIHKE